MWEGGGGGAKSSTLLLIGIALTGCQTLGAPAKEQSVRFQKLEDGRVSRPLPIPVLFYFLRNFCNCIIRATSALFCRSSSVYQPRVPVLNSGQFQAFSTQVSSPSRGSQSTWKGNAVSSEDPGGLGCRGSVAQWAAGEGQELVG